ncbi:hypothetical protein ACA910_022080 [Epithemia clementina (nom. ined.)]
MHPMVRNLYKRVLHVGRDYPTGLDHVKKVWKEALRNTKTCPSCYNDKDGSPLLSLSHSLSGGGTETTIPKECNEELLRAVHRGRHMVKEMIGVIKLKKYRAMKQRYGGEGGNLPLQQAMDKINA